MTSFLARTRWMVFLACCWSVHCAVLLARPVNGDLSGDEAGVASAVSNDMADGSKAGLSFPTAPPAEVPFRGDAELFSSATRATGSVILLAGSILIAAFLLKRYWPGRFGAVSGERHIEVLETVALGERQNLTLVQIGQSRLLLARTAGTITLLDRTEVAPESLVGQERDLRTERQERSGRELTAAISRIYGILRPVEGWRKAGLAHLRKVVGHRPSKPGSVPTLTEPSFEQIMHAELTSVAVPAGEISGSARSRLSEIRSRLQAE